MLHFPRFLNILLRAQGKRELNTRSFCANQFYIISRDLGVTPTGFSINLLLHKPVFTQTSLFFTQTIPRAQSSLYTRQLLNLFTPTSFYTIYIAFTQTSFYTNQLLHRLAATSFYN
jgi:hypothetical protein